MMGGKIDWSAMPILIELYGIDDVPIFIAKLDAIKDHVQLIESLRG